LLIVEDPACTVGIFTQSEGIERAVMDWASFNVAIAIFLPTLKAIAPNDADRARRSCPLGAVALPVLVKAAIDPGGA